jgi:hypothetical protein
MPENKERERERQEGHGHDRGGEAGPEGGRDRETDREREGEREREGAGGREGARDRDGEGTGARGRWKGRHGPDQGLASVPCCPELAAEPCCDRLTFNYRLVRRVRDVAVEVRIEALLERCPGPLSLGELVYSTTLLPGETVRLHTSSRKTRFTYDAESEVTYRHEQTSEESFYMSSMSRMMSDISSREDIREGSSSSGSFRTDGSVSGALETFFVGGSAKVSGEYSAESIRDFSRELYSHAEVSHGTSVESVRAASSVSMGEVQSRQHAEGESEDSYEASTRSFSNPNRCHAVTYFAYQINKTQTTRFSIVAIHRRVIDPAGDTEVTAVPPRFSGDVSVIPQGVLATDTARVTVESVGRASSVADRAGIIATGESGGGGAGGLTQASQGRLLTARDLKAAQGLRAATPLTTDVRQAALQEVDKELVAVGLLDQVNGGLSEEARQELSFEVQSCLPTPAILIKGCLDECSTCEPALEREIQLELERKALENRLLERRIELLEQSQEYRCCPKGEE